jgi:hypothetical protein
MYPSPVGTGFIGAKAERFTDVFLMYDLVDNSIRIGKYFEKYGSGSLRLCIQV